jgi:glucose-6-phosphate-specific signal transduction histidine kinase
MLTPDQFFVNEAWIAVRVNETFLFVKNEPYDIYVLMDAASAYVLGHVLSRVVDESPNEKDIETLFKKAWEAKNQWAEKLILTENSVAEDVFRKQAEKIGISVKIVPSSDLEPIVGPLKELFASGFVGDTTP